MRRLATVRTIDEIRPIPDADRIVQARIGGWLAVVGKGMGLRPGDRIVYVEPDSMLPESDPRYAHLMKHGVTTAMVEYADGMREVTGHVLNTMRLRGAVSQGLVLTLEDAGVDPNLPDGMDVTEALNVGKYEPPQALNSPILGRYRAPCPKTDAERCQNLQAVWGRLREYDWTPTVKVDGTSSTMWNDDGHYRVFSRNNEVADTDPRMLAARDYGLLDALKPGGVVQFELAGPKISGNRHALSRPRPFVFSAWRDGISLPREAWPAVWRENAAPLLDREEYALPETVERAVMLADGLRGHITEDRLDEGIVWHLAGGQSLTPDLLDALGGLACLKAINNSYLIRHGL